VHDRWIEKEFDRSGLPRSGLASYLGIDNAAVSRIVGGKRWLNAEETLLAKAFFSIVPQTASAPFVWAVRRLRARKIREAVGLDLVRWASAIDPREERAAALRILLEPVHLRKIILRADQIVALCRSQGIDLPGLIEGKGVQPGRDRGRWGGPKDSNGGATAYLAECARLWAAEAGCPKAYEFERGSAEAPKQGPGAEQKPLILREADRRKEEFESCTPYVVPDDSLAPRFEQGQTIFLADLRSEPRNGDYVAILFDRSSEAGVAAIIGRLLYQTRDVVGIRHPESGNKEILKSTINSVRRVAFCAL
jgi:hypothetical protein